ncbi:transcriptional regulator, Cro/CI family [Brevundimonas abyssalis TAR-001]|uniref:Transcriptional regulator, Cro/CI family n=2 Tax=Caulobacteraceae TaxID=76892 RepID=A0A8E0TTH9_9CAUL|nr:transcriptional regulator, Cro/CI family [Brevundimonas abyssalis TAR-001]
MNMPPRSYEHFESGAGRVNLEHLHRFAKATDSDAHALIACLALGSPEFALRCADNKLMTILMVALKELDRDYGDTIAALDVRTLVNAFTHVLEQIGDLAQRREQDARGWLEAGVEHLTSPGSTDTE